MDPSLQEMNRLLDQAAERKASDLYLYVLMPPMIRAAGHILPLDQGAEPLAAEAVKRLAMSLLNGSQTKRFEEERELDIAHQSPTGHRFRINLHWEKENVGMVARAIPREIPSMDDLDLPPVVQQMTGYPHGLVLVTGPTGSGKSTTLASMIDSLNRRGAYHIITLEDPIEYIFTPVKSMVRQRQFEQDFTSFQEALKRILRQTPDIVMIGEMRDPETISAALTIAETGHLVFATLHTYSAAQTIDRIVDAIPPDQRDQVRVQLALTLRAVVSQRLLPAIGGGRVAGREILVNNSAVANLIRENQVAQIRNVLQTSADEGMTTLAQDLKRLVKSGRIDYETAQQYLVGDEKLSSA
ncbi:hypothetical protein AMJ57_05030 [Parcubacteria bacterium SG8_24]|nr:MAG: hypothetical protein AMJ57_05030 [Parcubacteria bacterium SG8_24]